MKVLYSSVVGFVERQREWPTVAVFTCHGGEVVPPRLAVAVDAANVMPVDGEVRA